MRFVLLTLFVAAAAATAAPVDLDVLEPVEVIVNGVPDGHPVEVGDIVDITLHEHIDGEIQASSNLLHPYTAVGLAEIAAAEAVAAAEAAAQEEIESAPVVDQEVPEGIALPEAAVPEVVTPEEVALPEPAVPEVVIPEGVALPEPAIPEVDLPEAVALPEPAIPEVVLPEGVALPEPAVPEVVIPEGVALPEPAVPEVVEEIAVNPEVMPLPPSPEAVEGEVAPEVAPVAQLPNGEVFNDGGVQVIVNTNDELGYLDQLKSWFSLFINYFDSESGVQTTHQLV